MAVYLTNTNELTGIANAIREKGILGNSTLSYPSGFVNAIGNIASTCNATASDILNGKTGFTNSGKVTGNIASQGATTYQTKTSAQTIAKGKYLSGAQTILGVYTSGISAGNIKEGVTFKVGDANSDTRIKNIEGTCIPASLPSLTSYCPFMWRNGDGQTPSFYTSQSSSGSTAQTTSGYAIAWVSGQSQGNHRFRVPCNMTITYFSSKNSSSTSTVNLTAGTTYRFFQYDATDITWAKLRQDDGTDICNIFKITSWAVT